MATVLNKDVVRETKSEYDDRNLIITLTKEQSIKIKPKGLKSGDIEFDLVELYTLNKKTKETNISDLKVSYNDLRGKILISEIDYKSKAILESILKEIAK